MKKILLFFTLMFIGSYAQAQVPQFDKLEMFFSQRHYKKVYRKSGRLLDKPEYDYSMLPSYYRSLSTIQLAQNSFWNERHPNALGDAKELFISIKESVNRLTALSLPKVWTNSPYKELISSIRLLWGVS